MEQPDKTSYRPVRAIGLLLILQVIGLVAFGAYEFSQVFSWTELQMLSTEEPPREVVEAVAFILFFPPAVLMLLSALGFLLLRRKGWLLAALAQGLCLGVCLWLYTRFGPYYAYPIMAYCVLMILYLNSHDVRVVFHVRRDRVKPKRAV